MTNNKPKTNYAGDIHKVSQMDICQTPPHAIEPLLEYIPKDYFIWESAAGPERLLAHALRRQGYIVYDTDLLDDDKYNFFRYDPWLEDHFFWDIQITNMPFSIKYKWLKRSFELKRRFALLAPYETTFAKEFQTLFKQYNANPWYIEVLSPERRIDYKMPNKGWDGAGAQMPTCWITWGLKINRGDYLRTYYVPMRKVKYNDDNTEKI